MIVAIARLLGGDCLVNGCVPSKALIRSARAIYEINQAGRFGASAEVEVDFPAVMEPMRKLRTRISSHDSVQRFADMGLDVFLGHGRFTSPHTVDAAGKTLRFKKPVIATGSLPSLPPVEGINSAGIHTNETIFTLTERPGRFGVQVMPTIEPA